MIGALAAGAVSAQTAPDPKANRGPFRSFVTLKALGNARAVEGPVAYDTVLFSQALAYTTTGVLKADLKDIKPKRGKEAEILLPAGTVMFALAKGAPDANTMWCTLKAAGQTNMCVAAAKGRKDAGYVVYQTSANPAFDGGPPASIVTWVQAPEFDVQDKVVDSGYRIDFALKTSETMTVEKRYYIGDDLQVSSSAKLMSRHDVIFSNIGGEALYVAYDPASNRFSAKRFDTEAEAVAQ